MTATAERFELDPALLGHLMARQAPDLAKAILELVMNGVDGGAPNIAVTIARDKVVVQDDGHGLPVDADEIRRVFGRFGYPHEEGDAELGEYRLGRGQALAMGRTEYRSGPTRIVADFARSFQDWTLEQGLAYEPGCRVTIELTHDAPEDTADKVRRLVRHLASDVTVDGKKASWPPSKQDWALETDDAYVDLGGETLAIYNRGAFVREYVGSHWGVTGTVVSKHKLKLTLGRNEVMQDCPVFERIVRTIEAQFHAALAARRAGMLPIDLRRKVIRQLKAGKLKIADVERFALLQRADGRWITLAAAIRHDYFCMGIAQHAVALHALKEYDILVLDGDSSDWDEVDAGALLRQAAKHHHRAPPREMTWQQLLGSVKLGRSALADDKLPKAQRAVLFGLQFASRGVAAMIDALDLGDEFGTEPRTIVAAAKDSETNFTDGETFIALDPRLIADIATGRATPAVAIAQIAKTYIDEPEPTSGAPRAPEDQAIADEISNRRMTELATTMIRGGVEVYRHSVTDDNREINKRSNIHDLGHLDEMTRGEINRMARQLGCRPRWGETAPMEDGTDPLEDTPENRSAQEEALRSELPKTLAALGLDAESIVATETGFMATHKRRQLAPELEYDPATGSHRQRRRGQPYRRTMDVLRDVTGRYEAGLMDAGTRAWRLPDEDIVGTAPRVKYRRLVRPKAIAAQIAASFLLKIARHAGFRAANVNVDGANASFQSKRDELMITRLRLSVVGDDATLHLWCHDERLYHSREHERHARTATMSIEGVKLDGGWLATLAVARRAILADYGRAYAAKRSDAVRNRAKARRAMEQGGNLAEEHGLDRFATHVVSLLTPQCRSWKVPRGETTPTAAPCVPVDAALMARSHAAGANAHRAAEQQMMAAGWRRRNSSKWKSTWHDVDGRTFPTERWGDLFEHPRVFR